MQNIIVKRYPVPTDEQRQRIEALEPGCRWPSDDWQGWIEPDDKSWIAFIDVLGRPQVFLDRAPSGAVIGPCHALA